MRPHFLGNYPIDCHPETDPDKLDEAVAASSAAVFDRWQWLIREWKVEVSLAFAGGSIADVIQPVDDGEDDTAIPPVVGYTNEYAKICPRQTGTQLAPVGGDFPFSTFSAVWNGTGQVTYVDGVQTAWGMHCLVFLETDPDGFSLTNKPIEGFVAQDNAFLYFDGIQFPLYANTDDSTSFDGYISIDPADEIYSPFWEYRREDTTNPVRSVSSGAQLISSATELNIR